MHDDDQSTDADRSALGPVPGPRPAVPRPGPRPGRGDDTEDPASDGATGDAAVDEALSRLTGIESLPVREHVAVFDAVHAALQDRLADVED